MPLLRTHATHQSSSNKAMHSLQRTHAWHAHLKLLTKRACRFVWRRHTAKSRTCGHMTQQSVHLLWPSSALL